MTKKEKLKELLDKVNSIEAKKLKAKQDDKLAAALEKVGAGLMNLPDRDKDIKPLASSVTTLKKDFEKKQETLISKLGDKFNELGDFIVSAKKETEKSTSESSKLLFKKLERIQSQFSDYIDSYESDKDLSKAELDERDEKLKSIVEDLRAELISFRKKESVDKKTIQEETTKNVDKLTNSISKLEKELERLRKEWAERLTVLNSRGGGGMNRQIKVGGTDVLTKYTDINFVAGAGITLTAANDNTDKNVDITITSTADLSVTLADVSANSLTTPNSLYQMTSGVNVEFKNAAALSVLKLTESTGVVSFGAAPTFSTMTAGSVLFAGTGGALSQDNANFFWDDTNNRLGLGTVAPSQKLDVNGNILIESTNSLNLLDTAVQLYAPSSGNFRLYANGADRLTVLSTGEVGIGTSSPLSSLDVRGGILTSAGSTNSTLVTNQLTSGRTLLSSTSPRLLFEDTDGTSSSRVLAMALDGDVLTFKTLNDTGSANVLANILVMNTTTGNVGIGTAAPTALLHLSKSQSGITTLGDSRVLKLVNSNGASGERQEIGFGTGAGAGVFQPVVIGHEVSSGAGNTKGNFYIATRDVTTDTAPTIRLLVDSAGNVGIGTTGPDRALEINSATGANLRLTYNDSNGSAANYTDYTTDSAGNALITASSGLLGIGTGFTPQYALDVRAPQARLNVQSTTGTNYSVFQFQNTGGAAFYGIESSVGGTLFPNTIAYAAIVGQNTGGRAVQFATSGGVQMTLLGTSVGIGTTSPAAHFQVTGSYATGPWSSSGAAFDVSAATLTDVTSSGTVAVRTGSSFGIPTFANSNAVTITDAFTLYVRVPVAGANTTITRANSAYFEGAIGVGTSLVSANIHSLATTEQLRLGYDASNYASFTTSSGGDLTIAPSGLDTTITGTLSVSAGLTPRVVTTTDDSTAVIDVAVTDVYELSAVANNTTFSFTGTPKDGQKFLIRYKDAGVSKTLTWTGFVAIGVTLPAATTVSKWGYVGVVYNSAASAYHAIAVTTEA